MFAGRCRRNAEILHHTAGSGGASPSLLGRGVSVSGRGGDVGGLARGAGGLGGAVGDVLLALDGGGGLDLRVGGVLGPAAAGAAGNVARAVGRSELDARILEEGAALAGLEEQHLLPASESGEELGVR